MAVLPHHPGLRVSIVSDDGTALREYPDSDAEPSDKVISSYIEAKSGTGFGIRWELTSPWPVHTLLLYFYVDEEFVDAIYCDSNNYGRGTYARTQTGATSVVNGQELLQKLAFAALDIDDRAIPQLAAMKDIKGMGEIKVRAHFVKNLRDVVPSNRVIRESKHPGKISEKVLKGQTLSHQTSFGVAQPVGLSKVSLCDYVDPTKQPFATYKFKYRSKDALKSLLVIPRSPSPVPLEERDVDTLSPEEMRELLKRQRERDAAARAVKQEQGIKRERSIERSSTNANDNEADEVTVVSAKKRRTSYKTALNENGVEEIDLT